MGPFAISIKEAGFGLAFMILAVFGGSNRLWAQESSASGSDLAEMSLENLAGLDVQVTSSAKKAESLRNATSAIFVITSEDIRNSGFQHLADLLRMVPGVQVAQNNASEWGISARGFNAQYNNKMLVLVDGRSVYESKRGGVIWREQDLPLEDIDHIEVIRGPGGTLWGSNAVNGVINIITKDAKVTQGLYMSGLRGNLVDATDLFRYGGKVGDLYYRVYGKDTDDFASKDAATGNDWHDAWNDQRIGFRADWHGEEDQVTLQGDYQQGRFDYQDGSFNPYTFTHYTDINTNFDQDGNLLARWVKTFSDSSEGQLQVSYDIVHIQTNDGQVEQRNTLNLEFQHRFFLNDWNEVTWGGQFRNISDLYRQIATLYVPGRVSLNTYSGFLQDKLTLVENRLYFTGGAKLENNPYTGNELQPSGRLLWTPDPKNSIWGAVSRAVRVPNRFEESGFLFFDGTPGAPNTYSGVVPNSNLKTEEMVACELGYRTSPAPGISLDFAAFYNRYTRIITNIDVADNDPSPLGGTMVGESEFINVDGGYILGGEVAAEWKVTDSLKFSISYSHQNYDPILNTVTSAVLGVPPPEDLFSVRVYARPASSLEFNTALYYSDETRLTDSDPTAVGVVPNYIRWDLGSTWRPVSGLEVSLWGQNLQGTHTETLTSNRLLPTDIVPGVYGQITARY